ncbi:MAG: hypothetical protein U0798_10740 [Gemmataceae bacterium]
MVTIDLRKDAADILAMLADAVRRYAAKHKASASAMKHPLVTRIDLIFSLGDSDSTPWVHLHFDTKSGSEPDGDPSHPDFGKLTRSVWLPAVQAVSEEETVIVVKPDGKSRKCNEVTLTETIGKFLVDTLLEASKNGVFTDLPKADRCELGVEDPMTGEFGWPNYDDRGKKNLVK